MKISRKIIPALYSVAMTVFNMCFICLSTIDSCPPSALLEHTRFGILS